MNRILVTTDYLEPDDEIDRLLSDAGFDVVYSRPQDRNGDPTELIRTVGDAVGIIAGTDPFTGDVLRAAARLRIIARTGAGFDNIDLDAARDRKITVCTTPGANSQSVAELTIALLLDCARLVSEGLISVRSGEWHKTSGCELRGSTLGIVGFGKIGQAVAGIARAIGMRVIAYDPNFDRAAATRIGVEAKEFDELLAASDAVSVHLGLTPQTRGLIDADALAQMKSTAFLINTARGGIVDEQALADALHAAKLGRAALDVLDQEPMRPDNPLRSAPNIIITPHVAGATIQARSASSRMAADQIIDFFHGWPVKYRVAGEAAATAAGTDAETI